MSTDYATQSSLKLCLHIGTGKTGTTSVQSVLDETREGLLNEGIYYLGMMLEYAPKKQYEWQRATTVNTDFQSLAVEQAVGEAENVFNDILEYAQLHNIHTLVWSNESFFEQSDAIIALATEMVEHFSIRPEFVVYVRRHDDWMRSAYLQWGIKHKTYEGKILPFSEWSLSRMPAFTSTIKKYQAIQGSSINLRNYDAVDDVVLDFAEVLGSETVRGTAARTSRRQNRTPAEVELYLRTVFNNKLNSTVLPRYFDELVGKSLGDWNDPATFMRQLLPDNESMSVVRRRCTEDLNGINTILTKNNQPPLQLTRPDEVDCSVDSDVLLAALSQIVLHQSLKIRVLERSLEEVKKTISSEEIK